MVQVFVVPEDSRDAARKAMEHYRSYLKASGQDIHVTESREGVSMTAVDPLYKNVFIEHCGCYLIGAVRAAEISGAKRLVDQLRKRLTD